MERLAKLLGVAGDSAYTCETAAHFWLLHVLSRWEAFLAKTKAAGSESDSVLKLFPFRVSAAPRLPALCMASICDVQYLYLTCFVGLAHHGGACRSN